MWKSLKWTFFRKGRWVAGSIWISDESTWVVMDAGRTELSANDALSSKDALVIKGAVIASGSRVAVFKMFLLIAV
jgi:hypothetical protein